MHTLVSPLYGDVMRRWSVVLACVLSAVIGASAAFFVGGSVEPARRHAGAPRPKLFRPPKGLTDEVVGVLANANRYRTIFWDLTVEHFVDHAGVVAGVDELLEKVRPGSIILAHDGGIPNRARTVHALPLLLRGLRARGYRIVSVSQLLANARRANVAPR